MSHEKISVNDQGGQSLQGFSPKIRTVKKAKKGKTGFLGKLRYLIYNLDKDFLDTLMVTDTGDQINEC